MRLPSVPPPPDNDPSRNKSRGAYSDHFDEKRWAPSGPPPRPPAPQVISAAASLTALPSILPLSVLLFFPVMFYFMAKPEYRLVTAMMAISGAGRRGCSSLKNRGGGNCGCGSSSSSSSSGKCRRLRLHFPSQATSYVFHAGALSLY